MIIGITGSVGSGKSKICQYLKNAIDCIVIDTDSVAKSLMEIDMPAYKEIVDCFGKNILLEDGSINRKTLADIVFKNKEKLEILNKITHEKTIKEVKEIIEQNKEKTIIIESALLLETALKDLCDETWAVIASFKNRKIRLIKGRGYSVEKIKNMIASQNPNRFYKKESDIIIINNDIRKTEKYLIKNLKRLKLIE